MIFSGSDQNENLTLGGKMSLGLFLEHHAYVYMVLSHVDVKKFTSHKFDALKGTVRR